MPKFLVIIVLLAIVMSRVYSFCGSFRPCEIQVKQSGEVVNPVLKAFETYKLNLQNEIYKVLPSPHAELLLGMSFGIDNFSKVPRFNDVLKKTGTIHVVVVSGFNINLIISFLISIFGNIYSKKNFAIIVVITFAYAVFTGFEPPVVRACLMAFILLLGKYYGRPMDMEWVLMVSGVLLCIYNPYYLTSLSFWLSFLATLSLATFSEPISSLISSFARSYKDSFFFRDLASTLAAQMLVTPLISNKFGVVSLISPLSNAFLLWTIPLATVMGFVMVISFYLPDFVTNLVGKVTYIILDLFIYFCLKFAQVPQAQVPYSISNNSLIAIYAILFVWSRAIRKKNV